MTAGSEEARTQETPREDSDTLSVLLSRRKEFLGFISKRVGTRDSAEEILQAAYLKALRKGSGLRDDERVAAWFYRLLRNALVDHYRRRGAEARALATMATEPHMEAVDDPALHDEVCKCARTLVTSLKPEYAEILERVDLDEGELADVAMSMKITKNNATVRLHRARAALRARLIEFCGACTQHGCLQCSCRTGATDGPSHP